MLDSNRILRATDFAIGLHAANSFEQLGGIAVEAMRRLIACDRAELSLASSLLPLVSHTPTAQTADDARFRETSNALQHQDPLYVNRLRLLVDRPAWAGEFLTNGRLSRSAMYNEVWRPQRIRHIMDFPSPGRLGFDLAVTRASGSDFGPDDATILHVLARHLEAATESLIARNEDRLPVAGETVPVQRFAWLVCDSSGSILRSMPIALQQMLILAGPGASAIRLPEVLLEELRRRSTGAPGQPIAFQWHGRNITAHVAPIRGSGGEWSIGFLEHAAPNDPLRALVRLGLTRRESEVLQWVMEGKANADIAIILDISVLTVKKHMENVLKKLGVENRTAAVRCAVDAIRATRRMN